jgi:hypothetical protein
MEMAGNLIIAQNSDPGICDWRHIGCSLGSPVVVVDEQQYTLIKKYDIEPGKSASSTRDS